MKKPLTLIIMDGWGVNPEKKGNAIAAAKTPNFDAFMKDYPNTQLAASGNAVGLPEGTQGGSEPGHLTIGAGRIVWQPLEAINQAIKNGGFYDNPALMSAIKHVKEQGSNLHLMGLFSDQGVHATTHHLHALLELARRNGLENVFIHCFLDGRDVPEKSAGGFLKELRQQQKKTGVGVVSSIVGRYYAMDRDTNWDRTEKAYRMLVYGEGYESESAENALSEAYARGDKTDYYVQPTIITPDKKTISDGDAVIFYNFRSDRSRQITYALTKEEFDKFDRGGRLDIHFVCMSEYADDLDLPVAFPQLVVENNLGTVLSRAGLRQLRIAETEKYAHVTFFFNSQVDDPYPGEARILIDSPKVPSYDQQPEMSAYKVTERVVEELGKDEYDVVIMNYANPDLVGHSGVFDAVVECVGVVDECIGKVVGKTLEKKGTAIIMADHGNAEQMLYEDGEICPAHGTNPVPFILISSNEELRKVRLRQKGGLKDVAPTMLEILGIEKPGEMEGESLILR
ncbi:MAG: 2,3-bisphosphoglycerate-independent phosphoglycerate mutase [Candidatus Altiarchaeota archaeon]